MKRIAIDWGRARIGVAASDDGGTLAFARHAFARRSLRQALDRLRLIVAEERPAEIVVGLPLNADGSEGDAARAARRFAERAAQATGLPVVLCDERYSSIEADEALREVLSSDRRRRQRRDAEAARIILQRYLDGVVAQRT